MSLDSNGDLRLEVKYRDSKDLESLVQLMEDDLWGTVDVEETGSDKQVSISIYVQNDHFYDSTVTQLTNKIMELEGVKVLELESEILDEEGNHTKVQLKGNKLMRSRGEVVYTHFSEITEY